MAEELGGEGVHAHAWLSASAVHLTLHNVVNHYIPKQNKTLKKKNYSSTIIKHHTRAACHVRLFMSPWTVA